jgi:hypothetical protein
MKDVPNKVTADVAAVATLAEVAFAGLLGMFFAPGARWEVAAMACLCLVLASVCAQIHVRFREVPAEGRE